MPEAPAPDDSVIAPDDLASLPNLNNDAVLHGIRRRFELKKIYTRINNLLVAMNPYEQLPIYTAEVMSQYKAAPPGTVPPHVYGTSAASYDGLRQRRSQSIVISGESGAGKSETAKKVLQFLAFAASRGGGENAGIESRILASSPPLEAFGNAKTSMNNNSSRYGKFLMLQFDPTGTLSSANIKTYLLEKTRVITQGQEERGYHVGYMLCSSPEVNAKIGLPPAGKLAYLGQTGCLVSPGWDDEQEMKDCLASFEQMGVPKEAVDMLWKVVAATLLLGDLNFGDGDKAEIADKSLLEKLCALIEVDAERLGFTLTIKRTRIGADTITKPNTPARAVELRNGLAKSIYSTCFDWLVTQINRSLRMDGGAGDAVEDVNAAQQFIGILDIFGFERFEVNSLEQLCINFTNERLQSTFNEHVFTSIKEENAVEGVDLPEPDTSEIDNGAVVKLIGGKPHGILYSLNEECVVPKGSDQTFLDKLFAAHKSNSILSKPLGGRKTKGADSAEADALLQGFTVKHFVGDVTYTAQNMLDKNKDPKDEDLMVLLQRSNSEFVQTLFAPTAETRQLVVKNKKDNRFQGVAAKFQKQLDELLRLIGYSHMHFVRCVKPNREKVKEVFVDALVDTQLKCSGVFEAVRVIGLGYPDRLPLSQIIIEFARLLPEAERPEMDEDGKALLEMSEPDAVTHILVKLGFPAPKPAVAADPKAQPPIPAQPAVAGDFALGHSKVFLKAGVLAELRQRQQKQIEDQALRLQAFARGYIGRGHALRLREERQRRLEEEAAQALAEQMKAEEEAKAAAEEAARIAAAQAATAKERQDQERAAAEAADRLETSKAAAVKRVSEVEKSRSFMLKGAALGDGSSLAESRWRSVMRRPDVRLKLSAVVGLGGRKLFSSEEVAARDETKDAQRLLTKRSQSRMELIGASAKADAGATKGMGLSLNLAKAGIGLPSSILSHRDAGGGVAPLLSARAPQRKDVKKTLARQKKDARWMEMVYEYAEYLGMDVNEDAELLWIAEQALRAPVPQGWEEKIDPFDDLYFFNETTYQSTRQHPMDAYYQQLYLKVRLQKKSARVDVCPPNISPNVELAH